MTGANPNQLPDGAAAELTVAMLWDYLDDYAAVLDREHHDQDAESGHAADPVTVEHEVISRVRAKFDRIERTSSQFPGFLLEDELRELARKREERAALGGRVESCLARENDYSGDIAAQHITRYAERARTRATGAHGAPARRRLRLAGTQERDR
jgi:hypothetical protein